VSSVGMFDTMRRVVREEMLRFRTADLAVVTDVHPHAAESDSDNYSCSVEMRDTGIVLKRVPVVTSRVGVANLPEVGALVLVQFIAGEINAPVIIGSLYNNDDRPRLNGDGKAVVHLPLGASDSDAAHIEIDTKSGPVLKIAMGGTVVTIQDGDPAINIDAGGNATVSIGSNGDITLESSGNLALKAGGDLKVEAGGTLTLKGGQVKIN
jgi:phage baseplate assembly protein gpV